jgi:rod shape-determining protein MreD
MSDFLPLEFVTWAMRLMLAQGVIIIFLLLNVVSFSMPHAGDFKPFFLLMAVYYWAIYRPTVMPVGYTFVLGLIMDLLADLPIGLSALILIGLQTLVRRSRLFLMGQPYMMVWLGFAIMALANAVCLWLIMSLSQFTFAPVAALVQTMVAAVLSILLFPLASLILQGVHRIMPVVSKPLHSVG